MAKDREQVRIDDLQTAGYRCPYCGYCKESKDKVRKHISGESDADHRDRNGFDISAVVEDIPDIEPLLVEDLEPDDLTEKQRAAIVEYSRSPDKTSAELAERMNNRDHLPNITPPTVGRTLRKKCRIETGHEQPEEDKYSERNERQQDAIDMLARRTHEAGGITSLEKLDAVEEDGNYLYSVADRYAHLVMQRREELSDAPNPESLNPDEDPIANVLNSLEWYKDEQEEDDSKETENEQERVQRERGNVSYEGKPLDAQMQHLSEVSAHQEEDAESSEQEPLEVETVDEAETSQPEDVSHGSDIFAPIIVPEPEAEGIPARELQSVLDTIHVFQDLVQNDELDAEAALEKVEERLSDLVTDPDTSM